MVGIQDLAWIKGLNPRKEEQMEDALFERFQRMYSWTQVLDPAGATGLATRWERAKAFVPHAIVSYYADRTIFYQVESARNPGEHYVVHLEKGCTCPDEQRAPFGWCKHRLAAWQYSKWLDMQMEQLVRKEEGLIPGNRFMPSE